MRAWPARAAAPGILRAIHQTGMLFLLGFAAACGEVASTAKDAAVGLDAPAIDASPAADAPPDAPPPARCDVSKPFGLPQRIAELTTTSDDRWATLTADELTIVFASNRPGGLGYSDLYIATRATRDAAFGAPALVAGINSDAGTELRPTLSADGLTIYFEAGVVGVSNADLYRASRTSASGQFGAVEQAPVVTTSTRNEATPFLDGCVMYLTTPDKDATGGLFDIYAATRTL